MKDRFAIPAFVLIVAAVVAVNFWNIDGGLGWSDGPNHLFDGIFVYEFVKAIPLDDPRGWAEQFYLRYPTLGIVVYWPPGFAVVEALVFAIFGVSLFVARVLILGFVVGTACLMYRLGRRLFNDASGLVAALILIVSPAGERWAGDVMLEWPATFWIVLSVYAYVAGFERRRWAWGVLFAFAIVMAFLTKQTAGFVLPVILLHAVCTRSGRRWLFSAPTIVAGFGIVLTIGAYSLIAARVAALPEKLLRIEPDFLFYPSHLVEEIGWLFLALFGGGMIFVVVQVLRTRRRSASVNAVDPYAMHAKAIATAMQSASAGLLHEAGKQAHEGHGIDGLQNRIATNDADGMSLPSAWSLLLLWLVGWFAFCSLISAKEPRYFFFALPVLAFVAARVFFFGKSDSLSTEFTTSRLRIAPTLFAMLAVVAQGYLTVSNSRGTPPSYRPAVEWLSKQNNADLILIDAVRDGQFVFGLYQHSDTKSIVPLRASKLLYARAARMKYGGRLLVESKSDIVDLLNRYGIRYIVMESQLPDTAYTDADPMPRKLLRELVTRDDRFVRRGAWPLACDDPAWDAVELWVYEYLDCPARSAKRITIPVPAMGRDVELQLPSR